MVGIYHWKANSLTCWTLCQVEHKKCLQKLGIPRRPTLFHFEKTETIFTTAVVLFYLIYSVHLICWILTQIHLYVLVRGCQEAKSNRCPVRKYWQLLPM